MRSTKILALVLAGGNGSRLQSLTADRAKPALPLACGYRVIDFVLGNLVNSQLSPVYLFVQYKPESIIQHLRTAWWPWVQGGAFRIVRPRSERPEDAFKGTADAVQRNCDLIAKEKPDLVAVFAADHVYRMDVRQMVAYHEERDADVTVASVAVPLADASQFGIMSVDAEGRISDFREKPERPVPLPADRGRACASMGNYLFNPYVLVRLLEEAHSRGETDFGRHIIPRAVAEHRVLAYDFASNTIPGLKWWEERAYWRDIGTLDAYLAAQSDVVGPLPRFSLVNPQWPIGGYASRMERPNTARAKAALAEASAASGAALTARPRVHDDASLRSRIH